MGWNVEELEKKHLLFITHFSICYSIFNYRGLRIIVRAYVRIIRDGEVIPQYMMAPHTNPNPKTAIR